MDWPNLRENVSSFIDGSYDMISQSEWIIYRKLVRGNLSTKYIPEYDESAGEDKFKYIQILSKALIFPAGKYREDYEQFSDIGFDDVKSGYLIMFKFNLTTKLRGIVIEPQEGDVILSLHDGRKKEKPKANSKIMQRYKILSVVPSSGDYGRAEGFIVHADIDSANI